MDFVNFTTPYFNREVIKTAADQFRRKYWPKSLPVEIEKIADFQLNIEIVPITGIRKSCDIDAFITSNWQKICVDQEMYIDDRQQNRLRFSFAHEIGHFVLHKKIYEGLGIVNVDDYYDFVTQVPTNQYGYLETQANKFSRYLLVPKQELEIEREKALKRYPEIQKSKVDDRMVNAYIAEILADIFKVSPEVMEISLNEDLI